VLPKGPLAEIGGFGDPTHNWSIGDTVTSIAVQKSPEEAESIGIIRKLYFDRALVQWGENGPFSQERFTDLVWIGPPESVFAPPVFDFSIPNLELHAPTGWQEHYIPPCPPFCSIHSIAPPNPKRRKEMQEKGLVSAKKKPPELLVKRAQHREIFPDEYIPILEDVENRTTAGSFGRALAHAYPFSSSPPLDARIQPMGLESIRLFLDMKKNEKRQLDNIGGYDFKAEYEDTTDVGYAIAATQQPKATYESVAEKLKQVGLDLQKGRRSPSDWSIVSDQTIGNIRLVQRIPAAAWTGYAKGKGQQTVGDVSTAINRLGVEVEVEDLNTGEYGSDRAFEGNQFEKQQELYADVEAYVRGAVFPTVSYRNIGRTTEGHVWIPGDVVNVSRPGKTGGALALGHIRRVYPAEVMVEWPADTLHPTPWTTTEDKDELIFVEHDPEWLGLREQGIDLYPATMRAETASKGAALPGGAEREVPGLGHPYSSLTEEGYILEHYIESRMMGRKPEWATNLDFGKLPPFNPLKDEHDIWTEHEKLMNQVFKELDSNPFTRGHRAKYNLNLDDL